jgi:hypothetical protein
VIETSREADFSLLDHSQKEDLAGIKQRTDSALLILGLTLKGMQLGAYVVMGLTAVSSAYLAFFV